MINFDEVDFSERRSEEVISFFWHSVYIACVYLYVSVGVSLHLCLFNTEKPTEKKNFDCINVWFIIIDKWWLKLKPGN